jgi:MFS family permease
MLCLFACFVGTVNLQFWTGYLATVFFDLFEIEEDVFGYIIAS